jgi:hypothetical protein
VVTAAGIAPLKVSCSQSPCRGTLSLETTVILGRAGFALRSGQTKAVGVKLSRSGARLLRRLGKLRAKAILAMAGKRTTRSVVLLAPKRR